MSSSSTRSIFECAALAIALASAAGCTAPERDGGFAATIRPLQIILEPVVGERVAVLLGPAASPHTHDPKPSDVREAASAAVLFYGASELDGWASELGAAASVSLLGLVPDSLRIDADGLYDPHFWMDPLTVGSMLTAISDTLCHFDSENCRTFRTNARAFGSRLQAVHDSTTVMMRPARGASIVLSHPFLRYFARRYGLHVAAVVEEIPGSEPTIRDVQQMVRQAHETRAHAIFTLPQHPSRAAEVVSNETGMPLVELDPIGGGANGYTDLLYFNARKIRDALADEPTLP